MEINSPELADACDAVYQFCADYAKDASRGRLLVMVGENGCGKTHLAKAVNRWAGAISTLLPAIPDDEGIKIPDALYLNWQAVVDGFKQGNWDIVDDAFNCSLLTLDDIGAEHDPSKVGVDKLCQIFNRREHMWTIVTTNILPGSWMARFDRRVASRLFRNSTIVDMTKIPDYWACR